MSYQVQCSHMKRITEKNIKVFEKDVKAGGKYQYTDFDKYSAYIATKRQSIEIIRLLKDIYKKNFTILDVGCGDGTFTFEIYDEIKPKRIVGFDNAKLAVQAAQKRVKSKDKAKISFKVCNIYDVDKVFAKEKFDVAVVRGVLHHLYEPEKAIQALCKVSNNIIVLEPNGYNPILKVIEKTSPYHIEHEEKSYWPPRLNQWFVRQHFNVKEQQFFSIVPYFCPDIVARSLKAIEPFMESIPFIKRFYAGTNIIFYERIK